jgi:hypothetical protein
MPPQASSPPPVETHAQWDLRRQLDALLPQIGRAAHRARTRRARSEEAAARRERRAAQHPEFAHANLRDAVTHAFVILMVLAAFGSDVLTFRPTAEDVAHLYARDVEDVVTWLQILLPLAMICAELAISIRRYESRHETGGGLVGWNVAAAIAMSIVPALVAATQLADDRVDHDDAFWLRLAVMVTFAALLHGCVVFGGRAIHAAKAYTAYVIGDLPLRWTVRNNGDRDEERAGRLFGQFHAGYERHNTTYPTARLAAPAFDEITRRVLERAFGYEVIRTPGESQLGQQKADAGTSNAQTPHGPRALAGPLANAPRPATPDPETGRAADDGETSYLRTVLEQRVRDADAEVRPN